MCKTTERDRDGGKVCGRDQVRLERETEGWSERPTERQSKNQ